MAYIKNLDDEEQQGATPVATTQASGVMGQGVATGPQQALNQGWVNFDQYVKANEGQGEGIANAITEGANTAIKGAASKLNELETKAANTDKSQTQALNATKNEILTNPTKVDVGAYQKQMSEGYKGPTQVNLLEGWGDAYKAWGNAKEKYDALKDDSTAGRQAAVTAAFKPTAPNGYTRGMGTLDSFLLGADAKGKEALSSFTEQNKGIADAYTTSAAKAQAALDAQKAAYDTERNSVAQAVKDKQAAVTSAVGAKQAQVNAKNQALNEREDVLRAVMQGVVDSSGGYKTLDPSKFFSSSGRYTLGDLTTDDERATIEALNNLSDSNSRVDLSPYRPTGQAGVHVSQDAIKAALGFDYDPTTNSLIALATDGGRAQNLTNDPYYKKLIQEALKAKGYS